MRQRDGEIRDEEEEAKGRAGRREDGGGAGRRRRRRRLGGGRGARESVIGRARFVYLFVSRNGESAKRHRSLMQIDNSVTRFTRLPRQPPVKFQSRPSFAHSLARSLFRSARARFLGNFYTQSNKVRANSPGVHGQSVLYD